MSHKMFTINNTAVSDTSDTIPLQVSDFTSESSTQTGQIIAYDGTNWKNITAGGSGAFSLGFANYVDDSAGIYLSSSLWYSEDGYIGFRRTSPGNTFDDGSMSYSGFTPSDWEPNSSNSSFIKGANVASAGKYLCIAQISSVTISYTSPITLRWHNNAGAFGAFYQIDRYARRPTTMVAVANCVANDVIGIKFQDNTGDKDFSSSDRWKQSSLSIFKL